VLDWNTAVLPEVFFNRPLGLRPFCPPASLRFSQVAGHLPSPRLAIEQNDSQFFIPPFFNSLLSHKGDQDQKKVKRQTGSKNKNHADRPFFLSTFLHFFPCPIPPSSLSVKESMS